MSGRILMVSISYPYESDEEKRKASRASVYQKLEKAGIDTSTFADDAYGETFLATDDQFIDMLKAGLSVSFKHEAAVRDTMSGVVARMSALAEKIEKIAALPATSAEFNERCNVYMPGNALMSFNETMLMEDTCTDALQEQLDCGWRVIAACPQPDQRRPDYILGRFNPKREPDLRAERPAR